MSVSYAELSPFARRANPRRVAIAFALSILFHLVVAGTAGILALIPKAPPPPETTMRVVLVPPKPISVPVPVVEQPRERKASIEVPDLPSEAEKPRNPKVEADRNLTAASELPATGTAPAPTQEGRDERFLELQNRQYQPGKTGTSGGAAAPAQPAPTAPPIQVAPTPVPKAAQTPRPTATPAPGREKLAMLKPQATPVPTPRATPLASPVQQPRPAVAPRPAMPPDTKSAAAGYRPESRPTRIQGSISNRGRSTVEAEATPLGRYNRIIRDAIGSRWHMYRQSRIDLISIGTVRIKFDIMPSGKVENLEVLENSSNEVLATCSLRAILDAEIPPIPSDVAAALNEERFEIEFSFNIH